MSNETTASQRTYNLLSQTRIDHAGIPFMSNITDCFICCQPSDVFGIGKCQHPICMECSINIRVLDKSQTCPQCRFPIEMLYFVSAPDSWDTFTFPSGEVYHPDSKKYGIKFTTDYTVNCYNSYLAHSCQICAKSGPKKLFPTFAALKIHMSQVHQRIFCSICDQHLQSLSRNRIPYTKIEMENHLRGTNNEASGQRGHPLCWICQNRFFDDDFLNRHLKSEHFFCQLCDNMGSIVSFSDTQELYVHYAVEHFPCDVRDCQHMGIVFPSEEELQLHKADEHGFSLRNFAAIFTGRSNQSTPRGAVPSSQSQSVAPAVLPSPATTNISGPSFRTRPSVSSQTSNTPSVQTAILNMSQRESEPSSSASTRVLRSTRNIPSNQSVQTTNAARTRPSASSQVSNTASIRTAILNQSGQAASTPSFSSRVLRSSGTTPNNQSVQVAPPLSSSRVLRSGRQLLSNESVRTEPSSSSSSRVLRSSIQSNQSVRTAVSNNSRTSSASRIRASQNSTASRTTISSVPARNMRSPSPQPINSSPLSTSSDESLMTNNYGSPLQRQKRLIFIYCIAAIFLVIIFLVIIKFISKKS